MKKQPKPLSTKNPPNPSSDHKIIKEWMTESIMPKMQPIVGRIDELINELIPNLQYAIKWGYAYYGTKELGWIIQVSPFQISVNVVFLNGVQFEEQPPLGEGEESRYVKIKSLDEVNQPKIREWINQAGSIEGWK